MLNILIKFWLIILTLSHSLELTWEFFSSIHRQQTLEMSWEVTIYYIEAESHYKALQSRAELQIQLVIHHQTHHTINKHTHPPTMSFTMTLYETMMPITSFSTPSLILKEKKKSISTLRSTTNVTLLAVSECLLTCLMMPGWCLRASVCRPERCPASPCCWPAQAAACRPSAGSLRETTSPWDVETHIQLELHPWFYDPLVYYLVD